MAQMGWDLLSWEMLKAGVESGAGSIFEASAPSGEQMTELSQGAWEDTAFWG